MCVRVCVCVQCAMCAVLREHVACKRVSENASECVCVRVFVCVCACVQIVNAMKNQL